LDLMRAQGHGNPRPLSPEQVHEMQPGLSRDLIGGIFLPEARHVSPENFTSVLVKHLEQLGVEFRTGSMVKGFDIVGGKVAGVKTETGPVVGNQYVVAAGAWSGQLLRHLGIDI